MNKKTKKHESETEENLHSAGIQVEAPEESVVDDDLANKLNAANEEINKLKEDKIRIYAEMDNMRKRLERDINNAHKYGSEKMVKELLPVIDSLEHGIDNCDLSNQSLKTIHDGLALTRDMFLKHLKKFGVEQLDPTGKTFNPEHHEAISMQKDQTVKPNHVIKVLQKGYILNDRLLRPALVIVAEK
ncbi:MAG: nucleotide exchange factor GrpE [Gammaproteobacteria bacterium]|nr:nucleotide exchange factor GrpE [Gammaproteobacteria bacterium]